MLTKLSLLTLATILLISPTRSAAQPYYWGWQYQQRPAPRHAPPHHVKRHRDRSAAEWKASIMAQGKAYCRAHPGDKICPH